MLRGATKIKIHCFFEQSGTFKNAFKKLGYAAYDYDIKDEFQQTDYVINLFDEIEKAYNEKESIFDNISKDDLIFAFFPCTRFSARIPLFFRGEAIQQKKWDDIKKLNYSIKMQNELTYLYMLISKLTIVCIKRKIKLIIENPYTQPHYLTTYWCFKPKVIDKNRRKMGDHYRKPTQYYFFNFEPKNNDISLKLSDVKNKVIEKVCNKTERSMIHPQYAENFIKKYII